MSGRREAFVEALKVLEEAGINNDVTEKLRVEIAAVDREAEEEVFRHYFEFMSDSGIGWDDLSASVRNMWRKEHAKNKQYFTVKPESEVPTTIHDKVELDQWRQFKWKDRDGDIWDFRNGCWGYVKAGFSRSTTQSWLDNSMTWPMTRVESEGE